MHKKNWTRRAAVAATLGLLAAASALAQQRVIRIIVPFGPGAVQDTIARTFNNELGQVLGASVIVENRAGAGGTIGTAMVAKAPPDGNTLVLAAASHTLAGHLYAKLPYDPIKDFAPITLVAGVPNVTIVTICDAQHFTVEDEDRILDGTFTILGKVTSAPVEGLPVFERNKVLRNLAPDAVDQIIKTTLDSINTKNGVKIGETKVDELIDLNLNSRVPGKALRVLPVAVFL